MSRKRLKDMLKKEMDTRISSYSTSPAVNKEDDKPLIKGTDNVKNELLGKKKNDLPALDTSSEIKEIPIKKEEDKKEVVKDKRYNIFDSDSESDNGSEKGSDSEKDSESEKGSDSEDEEINKYKDSESEDSEEDYYKYYKRNSSSREKSVRYEDERKDERRIKDERENERRIKDERENERRKIKDERVEEKRRIKDEREDERRKIKDERLEEKRRVKDERVEEKRRVKDERIDVRKDERKDERRRVRDESEDDREDERKSVKDVRKYEDDIDSRNPFENIPKKAFLQLIKNSNINNISSDCVDEVKEIMNTFLINIFKVNSII